MQHRQTARLSNRNNALARGMPVKCIRPSIKPGFILLAVGTSPILPQWDREENGKNDGSQGQIAPVSHHFCH